ncbi:MAG: N-acyl homoserine lactonase family protein [Ktedonobacteraceae bacterium]|nr:N-acyl homoserine lactonase family protein [Ktedonobacteraceae bacterium]
MTTHPAALRRLYLMQVAKGLTPVVCYLVQTGDGKNILIDSGLPKGFQPPPEMGLPPISYAQDVVEQLALLNLRPEDIDILICTHFDIDHCGNHPAFARAELVVQRQHYELARSGHPRFARWSSRWDDPALHYRQLDGDSVLLPGIELIVTNGHTRGHQSVLVRLPETGPVLLTIDAVPSQNLFAPDRPKTPQDDNEELAREGARKLIAVAEREQAGLVVFGHDNAQWETLKKLPEYYS